MRREYAAWSAGVSSSTGSFRACSFEPRRDVTPRSANRHDGTVEAVFEGDERDVGELVQWVHEGPRGADVRRVEIYDEEPEELSGFEVR